MNQLEITVAGCHSTYAPDPVPTNGKYIVRKHENKLETYFMGPIYGLLHKEVANSFGIKHNEVIGGGEFAFRGTSLSLTGFSSDFGAIPFEFKEKLTPVLHSYLTQKGIAVKEVYIDRNNLFDTDKNYKAWQELGYSAANPKEKTIVFPETK